MTENKHSAKGWVALLAILLILVVDQIIKVEVKTNMYLHESIRVTDWFYITFVENNGMAYGMTFINKLVLTFFRMAAITILGVYLFRQVRANARWVYVVCLALVTAGATGNLIDCIAYGQIFTQSTTESIAHFVPWGQGYEEIFRGRVVDMLYFPLFETDLPQWLPFWGGEHYIFFSPVFNFADSCITVGVISLLLFCRNELSGISFLDNDGKKGTEEADKPTDTDAGQKG